MGKTIAICGDGASAVLLLSQLVEQLREPVTVQIIGSRMALGVGIAYATDNPDHLLNVPSARMSADPRQPQHFRNWLATRGVDTTRWQDQFVPRALYRHYLGEIAARAMSHNPSIDVQLFRGEAKGLIKQGTGWIVGYDTESLFADLVILATGNDLPAPLAHQYAPSIAARIIDNPWLPATIAPDEDILILGSALTAVDTVIDLLDRGHRGGITLLSRHGLLPHVHVPPQPGAKSNPPWPASALGLLMALRRAAGPAPRPEHWQGLVDDLRPHLAEIWQRLPLAEKRRVLRHGATLWNMHRHRIAPMVGARLKTAAEQQRFSLARGRLAGLRQEPDGRLTATIRHGQIQNPLKIDRIINCSGPNADPLKSNNGLIENIIASRQAGVSECGLGLEIDETNRVRDSVGDAFPSLFAMGALTRSRWWEITAIPEIAAQSAVIAQAVAVQLQRLEQAGSTPTASARGERTARDAVSDPYPAVLRTSRYQAG